MRVHTLRRPPPRFSQRPTPAFRSMSAFRRMPAFRRSPFLQLTRVPMFRPPRPNPIRLLRNRAGGVGRSSAASAGPNRKITRLSGQAAAPGAASAGPVKVAWWSGCLGEGDGVAEGFELADVVAGLALLVDAAGVVTGAEVVVAGGGIGEQVPDDHQDGAGDGDHGLELAPAPGQAPVAFPQEGVGPAGRGGGLAEHSLEVGVTFAGLAGTVLSAGLDGLRADLGPGHQVAGGGEDAHLQDPGAR